MSCQQAWQLASFFVVVAGGRGADEKEVTWACL